MRNKTITFLFWPTQRSHHPNDDPKCVRSCTAPSRVLESKGATLVFFSFRYCSISRVYWFLGFYSHDPIASLERRLTLLHTDTSPPSEIKKGPYYLYCLFKIAVISADCARVKWGKKKKKKGLIHPSQFLPSRFQTCSKVWKKDNDRWYTTVKQLQQIISKHHIFDGHSFRCCIVCQKRKSAKIEIKHFLVASKNSK